MVFKWLPGAVTLLIENVTPSITARGPSGTSLANAITLHPYMVSSWDHYKLPSTSTSTKQVACCVSGTHHLQPRGFRHFRLPAIEKQKHASDVWFLLEKTAISATVDWSLTSPFRQPFSRFKSGNFCKTLSGWWFQPIWKICSSKLDHFPKDRGEHKLIFELPPGSFFGIN